MIELSEKNDSKEDGVSHEKEDILGHVKDSKENGLAVNVKLKALKKLMEKENIPKESAIQVLTKLRTKCLKAYQKAEQMISAGSEEKATATSIETGGVLYRAFGVPRDILHNYEEHEELERKKTEENEQQRLKTEKRECAIKIIEANKEFFSGMISRWGGGKTVNINGDKYCFPTGIAEAYEQLKDNIKNIDTIFNDIEININERLKYEEKIKYKLFRVRETPVKLVYKKIFSQLTTISFEKMRKNAWDLHLKLGDKYEATSLHFRRNSKFGS